MRDGGRGGAYVLRRTCNECTTRECGGRLEINPPPSNSDLPLFLSHLHPPHSEEQIWVRLPALEVFPVMISSNHTLPHSELIVWTNMNQISALSESLPSVSFPRQAPLTNSSISFRTCVARGRHVA